MELARDIIIFLNQTIIKSPSRILVGLENFYGTEDEKKKYIKNNCILSRNRSFATPCTLSTPLELQDKIKRELALLTLKTGIGNCREFSNCGFHLLKNKMLKREIPFYELHQCSIKGGDHLFILIGEFKEQFSIICDPWARKKFFWHEHVSKLKNYCFNEATTTAYLEDFDPEEHRIITVQKFLSLT